MSLARLPATASAAEIHAVLDRANTSDEQLRLMGTSTRCLTPCGCDVERSGVDEFLLAGFLVVSERDRRGVRPTLDVEGRQETIEPLR
jgi:hypothetical protein